MIYGEQWTCIHCGWENLFLRKRCRHCDKDKPENVEHHGYPLIIEDKEKQCGHTS